MVVTVEKHPIFHDWYVKGDYVAQREGLRNSIRLIRRVEAYLHCRTERITKIDVQRWTKGKPQYRYAPGQKIARMSKSEYLRQEFLRTTNLDLES